MTIRFLGAGKGSAGLTNQPQGLDVGNGGGGLGTSYAAQFTNLDVVGTATPSAAGTWVTVLNVTGKGYLLEAYVVQNPEIKITIDGTVYFWGYDSVLASQYFAGILNVEYFKSASTSTFGSKMISGSFIGVSSSYSLSPAVTFPQPARTGGIALTAFPLFFNSSLKIEVTSTVNTPTMYYGIKGGYK